MLGKEARHCTASISTTTTTMVHGQKIIQQEKSNWKRQHTMSMIVHAPHNAQLHAGRPPIEPPTRHHLGEREGAGLPLLLAWPDPTPRGCLIGGRGLALQPGRPQPSPLRHWTPLFAECRLGKGRDLSTSYTYVPIGTSRRDRGSTRLPSWSWGWREGEEGMRGETLGQGQVVSRFEMRDGRDEPVLEGSMGRPSLTQ